jgi:ribosome-binding factor A
MADGVPICYWLRQDVPDTTMPSRRQRRVAELIHRELSLLLMLDARDPRLANVTVTAVDITPDLLLARVYFTVLGDDQKVAEAQAGLERATGYLRTQLAARVQLRLVPHLTFALDKSAAYGRHIDELLSEIAVANTHNEEAGLVPGEHGDTHEPDNPTPDEGPRSFAPSPRSSSGDDEGDLAGAAWDERQPR